MYLYSHSVCLNIRTLCGNCFYILGWFSWWREKIGLQHTLANYWEYSFPILNLQTVVLDPGAWAPLPCCYNENTLTHFHYASKVEGQNMKSLANEITKLAGVYTFILIQYHFLFSRINRGNKRKETRGLELIKLVNQLYLFTLDLNNWNMDFIVRIYWKMQLNLYKEHKK